MDEEIAVHALEPNPSALKLLTNQEFNRLRESNHDVPSSPLVEPQNCITCQGEGQFLWYANGPGSDVVQYACECIEQWKLHLWLLNCGIGLNYQRLSWLDVQGVEPGALATVLEYASDAKELGRRGLGLTLLGAQRGTGKSLLATLLLKRLLSAGMDGYFVTFQHLLDLFTATWNKNKDEEKAWFERRVTNAGVLVVDDMGREYEGRLGIAGPLVDHVMRTRVENNRPTIITTNKSLDELSNLYSVNALSLLDGRCEPVEFTGVDYRKTDRERLKIETKARIVRPVMV